MHKRFLLALCLAVIGGILFVATAFAGSAATSKSEVSKGGTLRINVSATDYEYLDPALAYDSSVGRRCTPSNQMLLNYPDKPASAGGNQFVPEAATGFPTVSKDGKTYTFTVKSGMKFSDGSNVTAAAFARGITRVLSPRPGVTGRRVREQHRGLRRLQREEGQPDRCQAAGQKLTVRLINADPTFLAQIAMPFFAAVKPNMPINSKGENIYPSAGPYRLVSREPGRSLVLERNTQYKGNRPANPDRIVVTVNTDQEQSLLQVKAGQADHDLGGVPAVSNAALADEFGVNKSRYFVNPLTGTGYIALNTASPTFQNVKARQAANNAVDRPALLRTRGKFGGKRTDQILAPQLPGFKQAKSVPAQGRSAGEGEGALDSGWGGQLPPHHDRRVGAVRADREVRSRAGRLQGQPEAAAVRRCHQHDGHEGDGDGRVRDRLDRGLLRSVRLHQRAPGRHNIQDKNNNNYSYWNNPKYNRLMKAASRLTGKARYTAYGNLDVDIMKNAAPWIPVFNYTSRDFVSPRVENVIYHPVYGHLVLNAMAIKK